jgi:hypothetical protein
MALLDSEAVALVRDLLVKSDLRTLETASFEGVTLAAALELVCTCFTSELNGDQAEALRRFTELSEVIPRCLRLMNAMCHNSEEFRFVPSDDPLVLAGINHPAAFASQGWQEYKEAFVRRLQSAEFPRDFAYAISASFAEMVENVPDHSLSTPGTMAPSLIGYWIIPKEVHFSVADLGRGLLNSLLENPAWAHLRASREAIMATLTQGATRRTDQTSGSGFKTALKGFVDHNGIMFVRSGEVTAKIFATGTGRQLSVRPCSSLLGVQVSASCRLNGRTVERALPHVLT